MTASARPLTLVPGAPGTPDASSRAIPVAAARAEDFASELRGLLGALRLAALDCRSAARIDVFDGCARLAGARERSAEEVARVLVQALPEALGARPMLYRTGVAGLTFDEVWLLSLLSAKMADDDGSFAFLLKSRVAPAMVRQIAFLAGALVSAGKKTERVSIPLGSPSVRRHTQVTSQRMPAKTSSVRRGPCT